MDEEALDRLISAELLRTKKLYQENWSRLEWLIEKWTPKASMASAKISKLQEHILLLEEEVEVILMERIRDKANAERYDRMIAKILVHEEDGKLDLEIRLKAPFRDHLDIFENGEQTDSILSAEFDYDRLGAIIYGDYYAG